MLHLAQVQKKGALSKTELRLLACQKLENTWSILTDASPIPAPEASNLAEGVLVLADVTDTQQITNLREATPWVLELVQKYLATGITPAFLQQETERAEQWRQSLTLQSQELDRRALELEARREQIQTLEEDLKREKRQLEATIAEYKLKLSEQNSNSNGEEHA